MHREGTETLNSKYLQLWKYPVEYHCYSVVLQGNKSSASAQNSPFSVLKFAVGI